MGFDTVLFDFDETLICSKPTYYAAYRHAVTAELGAPPDEAFFNELWGKSPQEALALFEPDRARAILEAFEAHYYHHHRSTLSVYPAVTDMLAKLRAAGVRLGIVSLKPRRAGEKELDICGLRGFFEAVIWGDDVAAPKPAPEGCLRALAELRASQRPHGPARVVDRVVDRVLMCGDASADIKMGRAAGLRTAAALWGHTDRAQLLAAEPDYAFDLPNQLADAILSLTPEH